MKIKKNTYKNTAILILLTLLVIIYLSPLGMMVLNAFKSYNEIMTDVLSWPKKLTFKNFATVFSDMNYPKVFINTLLVTVIGVGGIVLLGSMAGYKMARNKSRYSRLSFLYCIMPMMVPFQSFMITLVVIARKLGMTNSLPGLGIIYWGLGTPMAIFLYQGFTKTIPYELEEAAIIEGCTGLPLFFKVIFPLLKSVTASVIVVNVMWIWNDFLLPLLIIGGSKSSKTLQLAAYSFMGQYKSEWQNIMAAAILIIIPALVIYLIFQKHIIKGLVAGAVKG
ncbi:carbohydrate ABC transporter permease [Treponema sp. C6A8]|uniref:carbohydrate ABC transporter permease n=1 Tax=Treponema sp. C6A8 TaxID=1410609 RepID=UPI000571BF1D|nr:carbohydrate ABC transporter permease [Treponema sp. C6A8]